MKAQQAKKPHKLKIWAFEDKFFSKPAKGMKDPMIVSINPDSYKRSFKPLKRGKPAIILANGDIYDYKIIDPPPETFRLELWFDDTGAIPGTGNISKEIEQLKKYALLYNGDIHSTNYIKLEWGGAEGLIFKGQLQQLSVNYELFDRKGKPLRAKADATFVQYVDPQLQESLKQRNSPDLTHIRVSQAGDSLPLMCYRIYGDSAYYVQVARVNGLTNVITLEPGTEIVFPPLKV